VCGEMKSWTNQEEEADAGRVNQICDLSNPPNPNDRYQAVLFDCGMSGAVQLVFQQWGVVSSVTMLVVDVVSSVFGMQSTVPVPVPEEVLGLEVLEKQYACAVSSEDATLHPALANHPEGVVTSVLVCPCPIGQAAVEVVAVHLRLEPFAPTRYRKTSRCMFPVQPGADTTSSVGLALTSRAELEVGNHTPSYVRTDSRVKEG
jgi:hypothetical protein